MSSAENSDTGSPFFKKKLNSASSEYRSIKRRVERAKNIKLMVTNIEKVYNPELWKKYLSKWDEKKKEFPYLEEKRLFHGTHPSNVTAICSQNFQPSLCKVPEYGAGVYFSCNSAHACTYPSIKEFHVERKMFLARVMVANAFRIDENRLFDYLAHPEGYDTNYVETFTQQGFEWITVCKCNEDEYYPDYLITYKIVS